jgi:vitamin B12 transporter
MSKLNNSFKLALLSSAVFAPITLNTAALAEGDVEEIIVSANRREQPISEVGKSISVLTEEALKLQQFNFVVDALQTVPGVSINQNGTFGGLASVSIRGNSSDQTVILIDGVQVNDPSGPGGGFNFSTLDPNGIERIEVVRGPQAVLYGSDAIGGVVNIITKTGADGFGGSAFGEVGSYSSVRAGVNIHGGSEDFGYNLSASLNDTDGISAAETNGTPSSPDGNPEDDGFRNITLRGRVNAKINDALRTELTSTYSDSKNEFDSFGPVDGDEIGNTEEFLIASRTVLGLLDGRFTNTFSVEYSRIDRQNLTNGVESFAADGERFNLDYLGSFDIDDDWNLSGGAQREVIGTSVDPFNNDISINSVFGFLSYDGIEGLTVSGGLRVDDHETFGSVTNGQISASYIFEETGTRLIANWGEGFKAPTIFQLTFTCCGFADEPAVGRVDDPLNPERSNAFEIGIEQEFVDGRFKVGATYFDQDVDDLIVFTFADGYRNIDSTRSRGLEITFVASLTENLSFNGNYTYTSARDTGNDRRLVRRPRNQAFGNVQWQITDKLQTNVSVTYNGQEINNFGFADGLPVFVDGWIRVDLRASYQLNDTFELYGRIDNLFDEDYQQILNFGTPGASVFGGVRATF